MLHIALKRSKRINWSQTNTPSVILSPIWLTSNPRANSRLFPQMKSLKEACNIFNLVLCGKVFFPTTSLKHLEKKIEKGWWLHFLQSQMFLFFPIRASAWTELIDLLADDVRGRHSRSVYVHFIAHRLNKHWFSCPTWAKQENATRKRETWNTMELLSQCYTYS